MRWTKHLTLAHADKALAAILEEFGAEGYGVYWLMIEDIAAPMEKDKMIDPSATHSWVKWSQICHCSVRVLKSIANRLEEKKLIDLISIDNRSQITIHNILKYKDEYSKKSGQTPEQEQKQKERQKQKENTPKAPAPNGAVSGDLFGVESEEEKPAKEVKPDPIGEWFAREFWPIYPRKDDKEKALKAARKSLPGTKPSEVMAGLRRQLPVFATREREKIPLPTSWLNAKRWKDEAGAASGDPQSKPVVANPYRPFVDKYANYKQETENE